MTQKKVKKYVTVAAIITAWVLILVWLYYKIAIQGCDRGLIMRGFAFGVLFALPFYWLKKVFK